MSVLETNSLLEKGLGAVKTKTGPGEKDEGLTIKTSRLKFFLLGVGATMLLLAILVGVYAAMFQSERARGVLQAKKHMQREGHLTEDAVRMGFAVEQAENEVEHEEHNVERAFNRLRDFYIAKLDELAMDASADVKLKVNSIKPILFAHTTKEIVELKKAMARLSNQIANTGNVGSSQSSSSGSAAVDPVHVKLDRIAAMQEDAIENLLKTVSGVKLHALKELLEETFNTVRLTPTVTMSESLIDQVEKIADELYEENIKLDEGRRRFQVLLPQIKNIPKEMKQELDSARDEDAFAEALDSLNDLARVTAGKDQVANIEKTWRAAVSKIEDKVHLHSTKMLDSGSDPLESSLPEDAMQEELQADVDAVLDVHRLVAAGKLPTHLVDFTALSLNNNEELAEHSKKKSKGGKNHHDDDDEEEDDDDHEPPSRFNQKKPPQKQPQQPQQQQGGWKKPGNKAKRDDDDDDNQ